MSRISQKELIKQAIQALAGPTKIYFLKWNEEKSINNLKFLSKVLDYMLRHHLTLKRVKDSLELEEKKNKYAYYVWKKYFFCSCPYISQTDHFRFRSLKELKYFILAWEAFETIDPWNIKRECSQEQI